VYVRGGCEARASAGHQVEGVTHTHTHTHTNTPLAHREVGNLLGSSDCCVCVCVCVCARARCRFLPAFASADRPCLLHLCRCAPHTVSSLAERGSAMCCNPYACCCDLPVAFSSLSHTQGHLEAFRTLVDLGAKVSGSRGARGTGKKSGRAAAGVRLRWKWSR
jgi:hypothetical protein